MSKSVRSFIEMSDYSYPSDACECSDDLEWNYILDYFDVISYHDPSASAQFFFTYEGSRIFYFFFKILQSRRYRYLDEELKKGKKKKRHGE